MYKKLTDEQIQIIIDSGIAEFAHEGFVGANLSRIAKSAGVSVGVIYKYYADKKDLFLAKRKSLKIFTEKSVKTFLEAVFN